MFGNQPPHPPTFGKDIPKKNVFFLAASLTIVGISITLKHQKTLPTQTDQFIILVLPCYRIPRMKGENFGHYLAFVLLIVGNVWNELLAEFHM